jgi:hypothetical protein
VSPGYGAYPSVRPIAMKKTASAILSALFLSACIGSGGDSSVTPQAFIKTNQEKWRSHADRSYSIEYAEWDFDGTTTITCRAEKGVVGNCLSVYKCCGEDPDTSVLATYPTPDSLLTRLSQEVAALGYDSSGVSDTGFTVQKTVEAGPEPVKVGIHAEFDPTYGYPTRLLYLGSATAWAVSIPKIAFD